MYETLQIMGLSLCQLGYHPSSTFMYNSIIMGLSLCQLGDRISSFLAGLQGQLQKLPPFQQGRSTLGHPSRRARKHKSHSHPSRRIRKRKSHKRTGCRWIQVKILAFLSDEVPIVAFFWMFNKVSESPRQ